MEVEEICVEYRTTTDERWRIHIIPDTSGEEGWRIVSKREDGEWRITGQEPLSDYSVDIGTDLIEL